MYPQITQINLRNLWMLSLISSTYLRLREDLLINRSFLILSGLGGSVEFSRTV